MTKYLDRGKIVEYLKSSGHRIVAGRADTGLQLQTGAIARISGTHMKDTVSVLSSSRNDHGPGGHNRGDTTVRLYPVRTQPSVYAADKCSTGSGSLRVESRKDRTVRFTATVETWDRKGKRFVEPIRGHESRRSVKDNPFPSGL